MRAKHNDRKVRRSPVRGDKWNSSSMAVTERCSSGPYLTDDMCSRDSQGIGSNIALLKVLILFSQATSLKLSLDPRCFASPYHRTDLAYLFENWSDPSCSYAEIQSLVRRKEVENWANLSNVRIIHVNMLGLEKERSAEIDSICQVMTGVADAPRALKKMKQLGNSPQSASFHFLGAMQERNPKSIVYVHRMYYFHRIDTFRCTRKFIASKYWELYELHMLNSSVGRTRVPVDRSELYISFHFRYGDTTDTRADAADVNAPNLERRIPLADGIDAIKCVTGITCASVFQGMPHKIFFISENPTSNESVFSQFFKEFPNAEQRINTRKVESDLDLLGLSDVMIGGSSTFTALAAALNLNGINVVPYRQPKFWGILNRVSISDLVASSRNQSVAEEDISGDNPITGAQGIQSFNKFVCGEHAELYLNKDLSYEIKSKCNKHL